LWASHLFRRRRTNRFIGAGGARLLALSVAGLLLTSPAFAAEPVPAPPGQIVLADVGFVLPSAMRYDAENDRYLVANVGAGNDNDGFISIVSPDGKLQQLKWIEGGVNGVELNDPKGMVALNGVLYVADLKAIRKFDLKTGAQLPSIPIEGAVSLADLAIGVDGAIFVTDRGLQRSTEGAVYRVDPDGKVNQLERGEQLFNPHSIAVDADGTVLTTSGSASYVVARSPDGPVIGTLTLDEGRLDGLLILADGTILVSSWEGRDITAIDLDGKQKVVLSDVDTPAAFGFDSKRNLLLVPQIIENEVRIAPLPK
jgi:outer membrane protein assembly factor BamB